MRLTKPLFFFLSILFLAAGVSACATAEEIGTAPSSPGKDNQFEVAGQIALPDQFGLSPRSLRPDSNANVCFTMRTYRATPKERFVAGENGLKGYSTCQMGSKFQIRAADGKPPAKLK